MPDAIVQEVRHAPVGAAAEGNQERKSIRTLFEKGGRGSRRERAEAAKYFADFAEQLGLSTEAARGEGEEKAYTFILEVILPVGWYVHKIWLAGIYRWLFIGCSGVLLIAIPVILGYASYLAKGHVGEAPLIVGQLTTLLTGVIALQKFVAAALGQQQRYGAWHKAASDLKKIWYGFQTNWAAKNLSTDWTTQKGAFFTDMADRVVQARSIVSDEQTDYFQKLALPTVDVWDLLSKSKTDAANLIQNMAPSLATATAQKAELLKARQELAKHVNIVQSYEADIAAKTKEMENYAHTDPRLAVAKQSVADLQKARDAAVLAKRTAEASLAALQVT